MRQKTHRRPQSTGFTLIEILIVIVIIAVLALLGLLASGKIMDKARQTTAVNTIRQVCVANLAYSQENNGEINVVRVDTETKAERRPGRGYVADSFWGRITPYLFSGLEVSPSNQSQLAADIRIRLLSLFGTKNVSTMAGTFQKDVPIYIDGAPLRVPFTFNNNKIISEWNTVTRTTKVDDPGQTAYMTFGSYRFTESSMVKYVPHKSPRLSNVDFFSDRKAAMIFLDGHLEMVSPPMPKRRFGP